MLKRKNYNNFIDTLIDFYMCQIIGRIENNIYNNDYNETNIDEVKYKNVLDECIDTFFYYYPEFKTINPIILISYITEKYVDTGEFDEIIKYLKTNFNCDFYRE